MNVIRKHARNGYSFSAMNSLAKITLKNETFLQAYVDVVEYFLEEVLLLN